MSPILNIGLRGCTLLARFAFIFFLAKLIPADQVGYYGLFTATVGYSLYFVGLDFYVFTAREILKTPPSEQGHIFKAQMILSSLLYVIFLPLAFFALSRLGWPPVLLMAFVPILILEHLNQELMRLFIVLSRPLFASLLLFLRQGSWAIFAVGLMLWQEETRTLTWILGLWAASASLAVGLGTYNIYRMHLGGWRLPVNWSWVKKGILISSAFLVATLALRGIQTIDRYLLEDIAGIEVVAAYILFFGVAATFMTFMEAGVFSFAYPTIIRLYQDNNPIQAQAKIKRLTGVTLLCAIVFAGLSWPALPILLDWIDRDVYSDNIHLYPWLLSASVLLAFGVLPRYGLYAQNLDRTIVYGHIGGFIVFGAATALLWQSAGTLSVLIAINCAYGFVLVWKSSAYLRTWVST